MKITEILFYLLIAGVLSAIVYTFLYTIYYSITEIINVFKELKITWRQKPWL